MIHLSSGDSLEVLDRISNKTKFVVYLLEAIVIIVTNIISLVIFVRKFRHIKTYRLLINLSIADLLVGLYALLKSISHLLKALSPYGHHNQNCSDNAFLVFDRTFSKLVILESAATIALIAVERAYAVIKPIRHRVIKSKYYRYGIFLTWIVNTAPVFPDLFFPCDSTQWVITSFLSNGLGVMYFSIMTVFYVAIYVKMRFYPVFQHNSNTETQLSKTLFLTTLAIILCQLNSNSMPIFFN